MLTRNMSNRLAKSLLKRTKFVCKETFLNDGADKLSKKSYYIATNSLYKA